MINATLTPIAFTEKNILNLEVGLWIDHREALIVILNGDTVKMKQIESSVEKQPRRSESSSLDTAFGRRMGPADDMRQREYAEHMTNYYDEVIAGIGATAAIYIFGPGEAKGELRTRIDETHKNSWITVQAASKMTKLQIIAAVRHFFHHDAARRGIHGNTPKTNGYSRYVE